MTVAESVDVVIVGAGAAGLAAAVSAAEHGASVLVLEKLPALRGTTSWAVGSFAAAGTRIQAKAGIVDSANDFAEDIALAYAQASETAALRRMLAREAGQTLDWLADLGVAFVGPFPEPPNRVPRMHNAIPNGRAYLAVLSAAARRRGVTLRMNARAIELVRDGPHIVGVRFHDGERVVTVVASRGVILASGDFSGSETMRREHLPPVAARAIPINANSTGDGQRMAATAGAAMKRMDAVFGPQMRFPAAPTEPWFLRLPPFRPLLALAGALITRAPRALVKRFVKQLLVSQMSPSEVLFREGAVLVDTAGRRLDGPSLVEALTLASGSTGFIVGTRQLADRFQAYPYFISTAPGIAYAYFDDYARGRPDLVRWGSSVAGLARALGMREDAMSWLDRAFEPPVFALGPVHGMLTVTEGGAAVDEECRVAGENGRPIPGLFAAGGVGQGGLLLKGHGLHLAWALSSGRVAGRSCASRSKNSGGIA
jgi:fumarate reductase flavoprotein subunit